ncbi:laminin subunit beta-1-like [Tubulanus polymorphus]|uniref:laminin subunit beta-1-like n=1 Tax=Tubulanus polymorphus TaxID=672921 RepID=UPI003DA3CEAF
MRIYNSNNQMDFIAVLSIILGLLSLKGIRSQERQPQCEQGSCYPATGDLLIGRENRLAATSVCGLRRVERYCIVSHLEDKEKCFYCDSRRPYKENGRINWRSHRVENVVSTFRSRKGSWWQAENGVQKVSVQLDLEAEFHFTHLIMTFKTFRPAALLIERSYDFGKTWKVYRYFAYDCAKEFPGVPTGYVRRLTDVICQSRYSDVAPSTSGEVIFRVLPPSIDIKDPYSEEVQDLLKMTNLRINFTKLHTLGDNLLDSRDKIKEKYYYAVYDMIVRGRCSCYGHASKCVPIEGMENRPDMVHGKCECVHHTKGFNCEQCEDFYNELPWRPAHGSESNECKRCECNNHATRCHFDPAVYELTERKSGGVCDDCQHNTMGRNCQECRPFFYQDPDRDIRDPYICASCDCDPHGSENGGECDSRTDPDLGMIAGRCVCKRHIDGRRCDTCKNGYWDLQTDNPDGCRACSCNLLGTVGNYGCDKVDGTCQCKRYVTGRDCDSCMPEYWGMSEALDGCKPCECDVGGSYDNMCNHVDGVCNCRPNLIGRQCNQVRPEYFLPMLDYNAYEAEFARGIGDTRVVIRERVPDRPVSWTGPGFMMVPEGASLEFTISDIVMGMDYDIVIRYEPQMPDRWEDVRVTVTRPGEVNQVGPCSNSIPQDDDKHASLPSGSRYYVVSPSSCLERGVTYTIKIDFSRYRADRNTPDARILVDSIALIPRSDRIPVFKGSEIAERNKIEFERYRCRELLMSVLRHDLPEICKKFFFSISASIHQQASECDCDPMGSTSNECNTLGGQCQCKPNVIGRRCDQCAPGTYGFGPNGCTACDCDTSGSVDNFCDVNNGQCFCIANAYGQHCNECQPGFWNFPDCQRCECNGHADTCENRGGKCIDCRDSTSGHYCDKCLTGYFGDPRLGVGPPCRPCMCPGGADSGFQHADTCTLDLVTEAMLCDCKQGFIGNACDRCADNYFGNPLIPGGTCQRCICNNNIDFEDPGSCDATTGECKKCLYNTQGFSCEKCRSGFYGDATQHSCQACICDVLGTDPAGGVCDRITGQCPCLPHVIGPRCDRCEADHWRIASGQGCEACQCDPDGSLDSQCNQFDGQCPCKPGRGGRTCSDCETDYWGEPMNPDVGCRPCECNREGSQTLQCDRHTGQCLCHSGVTGLKCDRCDRGTTGSLPNCIPCGECFDNWDKIIQDLRAETNRLMDDAKNIKTTGAPGAFEKEFKAMEDNLEEVKMILHNTNVSFNDINELQMKLEKLRKNLTDSDEILNTIDDKLTNNTLDIAATNNRVENIKERLIALKKTAEELKANATDIRDSNVEGAYQSILESQRRSQAAQYKVDNTASATGRSAQLRQITQDILDRDQDAFDEQVETNKKTLDRIEDHLGNMNGRIGDLNEMVCGAPGSPCDELCGGAGCGTCGGGLVCDKGAVTKADGAVDWSEKAEKTLDEKEKEGSKILEEIQKAKVASNRAQFEAEEAFRRASLARNQSKNNLDDLMYLIDDISIFLTEKGAKPASIRSVAEEVLGMSISLTPEQIKELANQINKTIEGLTNIDAILAATRDDLGKAQDLKTRADDAKKAADTILNTAQYVTDALKEAERAQDAAVAAINNATNAIDKTEQDLAMVESETNSALKVANKSLHNVMNLRDRTDEVKKVFAVNKNSVDKAQSQANSSLVLANKAKEDADDLEKRYKDAADKIDQKYNMTINARDRANRLREKATKLALDTSKKYRDLKNMEYQFIHNEKALKDLSGEIAALSKRMTEYLGYIQTKAKHYNECQ